MGKLLWAARMKTKKIKKEMKIKKRKIMEKYEPRHHNSIIV